MLRIFHITVSKYIYWFYCPQISNSYQLVSMKPDNKYIVREGFRNLIRWSADKEMYIKYSDGDSDANKFHPDEFELLEFTDV